MVQFIPFRNWMVALGIAVGLALSSAVLGLVQLRWGPWRAVGLVNLAAAGMWSCAALVVLGFAMRALRRLCAARAASCSAVCGWLSSALLPLAPVLSLLAALCSVEAAAPGAVWGNRTLFALLLAALLATSAMLALAFGFTVRLRAWTLREAATRC